MHRVIAAVLCAIALGLAVASCGGSSDPTPDKLTIVGAGN